MTSSTTSPVFPLAALPGLAWSGITPLARDAFSPAWLALRGVPDLASESGEGWLAGVHARDRARCRASLERAARDGLAYEMQYRLANADGAFRRIRETACRAAAEGDARWVGICIEVPEAAPREKGAATGTTTLRRPEIERDWLIEEAQRARAEAEAAAHAKDEFLAMVSHELRSPLNSITGWTHVLEQAMQTGDASTLARAVEGIKRSSAQQARLIADLMDAAYLLSGKLKLYPSRVTIAHGVAAAIESARAAADAKQVTIAFDPGTDVPDALADPDRVQQMAWHLVANAVKFSPGGGTVQVRIGALPEGHVSVAVADSGSGFTPEALERALAGVPGSGAGVGLSLVRRLAELHGGWLAAESGGDGKGAVFRLVLPGYPAEVRKDAAVSPTRVAQGLLAGRHVLLLGEADTGASGPASLTVGNAGARVSDAASADQALAGFAVTDRADWPDVVVCDVGTLVGGRLDFIRKLRALEKRRGITRARRLRALALTTSSRAEDQTQLVLAGFEAILAKPFAPQDLVATIAGLLGPAERAPGHEAQA